MQIDWLTVAAQIVNFLVLIWLLKRLLYRRIVDAMARREQRIREQFESAQERERQAVQATLEYTALTEQLEHTREQSIAQARREADEIREQLREQARQEVNAQRERWLAELASERDELIANIRRQIAQQVAHASRRALSELADTELEQMAVRTLLKQLQQMNTAEREKLVAQLGGEPLEVFSSLDLPTPLQTQLTQGLRDLLHCATLRFVRSDDLICGLQIKLAGRTLGWNVVDYLGDLERDLEQAMQVPGKTA